MKWVLLSIIVIALFLRTYKLDQVPPSLFADEASIGYNAFTISSSGKDEFGEKYPIFFKAFGEYKGPVQIYSTVPFVKVFGLSELTTRMTSVVWGLLSIVFVFFLVKELGRSYKNVDLLASMAALLLAVSPWHIHFSRIAFEPMSFVAVSCLATWMFVLAQRKPTAMILSAFFWGLALYTNFPARVFIPLFVIGMSIVNYKFWIKFPRITLICFITGVVMITPIAQHLVLGDGLERYRQVSIFAHPPTNQSVLTHMANNYLSHFSWDYLFKKGDIDMPGQFISRHSVRGMGELYIYQLPFLILGMVYVAKRKEWGGLLLLWLVLYPTGTMFTLDRSAQATRSTIGVIPLTILTAIGMWYLFEILKQVKLKNLLACSLLVIISLYLGKFTNLYFNEYPKYSADYWGWQYGQKQIVEYFLTQVDNYDDLYSSGDANGAHIFFKFYDIKNMCKEKCQLGDVSTNGALYNQNRKQLFSVAADKIGKVRFKKILKIINYPSGAPAFYIGEI